MAEFARREQDCQSQEQDCRQGGAKKGIPVDDLYSLVESHPEYWSDDGTHFKPEGQAVLAKQVAKTILDALSK